MQLPYRIVDVFAREPLTGNPLAVFPDAPGLPTESMQAIAREMNLSETTFVGAAEGSRYAMRIFTPGVELPFAGHPTLGTAWVLRDRGAITGDAVVQATEAGETKVAFEGDEVWLGREGDGGTDFPDVEGLAAQLGVPAASIGAAWDTSGSSVELRAAVVDSGIRQLMVPVDSLEKLQSLQAADIREPDDAQGAYFFARTGPEEMTARFFAAGMGITEDAATGSAAAGLGLYLGQRVGQGRVTISQGEQIGRPSTLHVRFETGRVRVGGRVEPVAEGVLTL